MSITSDFSKFKKIDAHSHIGTFGSPFNIHFNADLLLKQMEEFNIEKTILCSDGPHTNEETVAAFKAHPDKIIPLMWINCAVVVCLASDPRTPRFKPYLPMASA